MKRSSKVVLGVFLALGITAGMILFVDLDYSRYADRVTDTLVETVTETVQSASINFEEIPKIKVFTGCADLYDEIAYLQDKYISEGWDKKTIGENAWLWELREELKTDILENNCQEWWMSQQ